MNVLFKILVSCIIFTIYQGEAMAQKTTEEIEILPLDVISYADFIQNDAQALYTLNRALYEKGIVGIKGIPGYADKVRAFIESARAFTALPEEVKETYLPNRDKGELFLGYEAGKERFKRPDGRWVVDDLKVSYYGFIPDSPKNKWPVEVDLKTPFQELGLLMSDMGTSVMQKIGLVGTKTGIYLDDVPRMGRMLYYRKNQKSSEDNLFWCGAHFDHGLFTALLPAVYFVNGEVVDEPLEAGLFVRTSSEAPFKKVVSYEQDILLFQVGEFGQLATDDGIKATEHRVHKADGSIERYTMALFFDAPMDAVIHSSSVLTADTRYDGVSGSPCSYQKWHEGSFNRYLVKEEKKDK